MYASKIYQQPVVILGSSTEPAQDFNRAPIWEDAQGNYQFTRMQQMSYTTVSWGGEPLWGTEVMVLKTTSVPVIWDFELKQDYQELGESLGELREFDRDDEWQIDPEVYNAACNVAANLMAYSFPAPYVFSHGPQSIVFNWTNEDDNLYLTVSANRVSALLSSPERIKRRMEYPLEQLADTFHALSSMREAAQYEAPIKLLTTTGPVANPPEFVGLTTK